MSLTDTMDTLASQTEAQLIAAYQSWQDGLIDQADFYMVAKGYLAHGVNRAYGLADAALAAYLSAATGAPTPALGLIPPTTDHTEALDAALADEYDTAGRVGRTGRAVTLDAAQTAYGVAMVARSVPHWTRVLNGGACEYCQDLAGPTLPASVPLLTHDGCGCTQEPVLN